MNDLPFHHCGKNNWSLAEEMATIVVQITKGLTEEMVTIVVQITEGLTENIAKIVVPITEVSTTNVNMYCSVGNKAFIMASSCS